MGRLTGKTAQISTTGQGIGRASALAMAREEAALVTQGPCQKVSFIAENISVNEPKILLVQSGGFEEHTFDFVNSVLSIIVWWMYFAVLHSSKWQASVEARRGVSAPAAGAECDVLSGA